VLVADDDEDVRALVHDALVAELGVRVEGARDGFEAILRTRDARPDLIVLDLRMPRVDGWGVLQWLKSRPETASVPVLLLAVIEPAGALQGAERGADRVLPKPFDVDDLVAAVAALLPGCARCGGARVADRSPCTP
jgi:two-component system chemotaxis response regulator CheY